jgi:hypothetical protein
MLVNSAKKVLIRVPKIQLRLTLAKDQGFLSDGGYFIDGIYRDWNGIKQTYFSTLWGTSSLNSSNIMRPETALESNSINTRGRTIS